MRHVPRSILVIAAGAILLPTLSSAAPKTKPKPPPPPPPPPVKLEIDSPAFRTDKPLGVMYTSGTTLNLKATIERSLGILSRGSYVGKGATGWIIFADPDNCPEVGVSFDVPLRFQPSCLRQIYFPGIEDPENHPDLFLSPSQVVPDETYLQFTIDRDGAGLVDFTPNAALSDPAQSGEPVFMGLTKNLIGGDFQPKSPEEITVGPITGGTVNDGFGYGSDDDLPGLVLLSNMGVGIVYQDADAAPTTRLANFIPESPRTLRNLAGFLESVSYELKSNNGKTSIHADMTLPDGLIAPILAVDNCLSEGSPDEVCDGTTQYQVDGGPLLPAADGSSAPAVWSWLIPQLTFEVRAFLVSGIAPSQLADLNGDGNVTAADATLAGYKVISNEAVTRFRQFPSFLCSEQNSLTTVFGADFDGNGHSEAHIQCPPGPGQLKSIP